MPGQNLRTTRAKPFFLYAELLLEEQLSEKLLYAESWPERLKNPAADRSLPKQQNLFTNNRECKYIP